MYLTLKSYWKYVAGVRNPTPDLTGRVYIVTGANSGIGKETALRLVEMNATVIMACRSARKAEDARTEIIRTLQVPDDQIRVLLLDLCDFDSVSRFVRKFHQLKLPLHGLVNNAGIMSENRMPTTDGMEATLHSNHLSHFLLSVLLISDLEKTK